MVWILAALGAVFWNFTPWGGAGRGVNFCDFELSRTILNQKYQNFSKGIKFYLSWHQQAVYGDFLFFYFYIFHPWKSFTNKLSRRLYWVALCCICEILFSYDFVNKSFMRVMTVIFLVFPYILPCARGTNSRMRRISPKVQERNRWRKRVEIDALKVNASICSSVLTRVMWQE